MMLHSACALLRPLSGTLFSSSVEHLDIARERGPLRRYRFRSLPALPNLQTHQFCLQLMNLHHLLC